jgi:hypothetical protein
MTALNASVRFLDRVVERLTLFEEPEVGNDIDIEAALPIPPSNG